MTENVEETPTVSSPTPPPPVVQHKLLIDVDWEPVRLRRLRRWLNEHGIRTWRRYPVQHRPCWVVLTATNVGNTVITSCRLHDVNVHGIEPEGVMHTFSGEFDTGLLNPSEHRNLELGTLVTFLEGQVWVKCALRLPPNEQALPYQRERFTRGVTEITNSINEWYQVWFVHRQADIQIARLNILLVFLTLITALVGVLQLRGCPR